MQLQTMYYGIMIALALCYIINYIAMTYFIGTSTTWHTLREKLPTIYGYALGGLVLLCIAAYMYVQNSGYIEYMLLGICCVSIIFSYMSIAFSALQ
jgi:hypothetical protein